MSWLWVDEMLEKPPSLRRWQEVSQGSSRKFMIKKDALWYRYPSFIHVTLIVKPMTTG
jgi:hypothetical protein